MVLDSGLTHPLTNSTDSMSYLLLSVVYILYPCQAEGPSVPEPSSLEKHRG